MEVRFRPIFEWPSDTDRTPDSERERARWEGGFNDSLNHLEDELRQMGVEYLVIQADIDGADLRLDGYPRANASYRSPAIMVSFETPDGAWHTYPSDGFQDVGQNIKAVAMTLRGLRLITGYKCAGRGQQYRGWQALPPGAKPGDTLAFAGPREAASYIAEWGERKVDHVLEIPDVLEAAYRQAAKRLHPDAKGGDTEGFQMLEAAYSFVKEHHARTGAVA